MRSAFALSRQTSTRQPGSYTNRLRDVTIAGFAITGFTGDGVFGFGTENLKVSHVVAAGNTAYGVASFDGQAEGKGVTGP